MTTQGFRCAATDCPILADPGRERCPERSQLCEYVRCSIDPEDMPSFEEWVAQGGMSGTYPDLSDRPGSSPVAPMSFNTPDRPHYLDEIRDALRRQLDLHPGD